VTIQDLKGDLADYYGIKDQSGVLVAEVVSGDPADRAGIKPKDIITRVNGKKITTSRDLTNLAAGLGVGDTADVTILREGKPKTLQVKIGKRPVTMAAASQQHHRQHEGQYGLEVTELTPDIARRFQVDEVSGVIVIGVEPDGRAAAAGVKKGDIIIEVNRVNVDSVKDFKNLIGQKEEDISMLVKRMNAGLIVIRLA
jgi:serine protease Do